MANKQYIVELIGMLRQLEEEYYLKDEEEQIKNVILGYDARDKEKISFKWNGKHGKEFFDANGAYRNKLGVYYCLHCEKENLLLCRDIFIEEAKMAKEAWGVNEIMCILGQRLLKHAPEKFIVDFIEGAFSSFDTYGCCLSVRLEKDEHQKATHALKAYISMLDENSIKTKEKLEDGLEYIKNMVKEA